MSEYVKNKVGPPGLALAILGLLSIASNLLGAIAVLVGSMAQLASLVQGEGGAAAWGAVMGSSGWQVTMNLISFAVSFVVAFGGLRLRNARSLGLVYLAAIFAMLPCCTGYCCCFGIPIGIWVLVTLQDADVKAAFNDQF